MTFHEAIEDSKSFGTRHLLLGNGFSIAFSEIFDYPSLLEAAEFSEQFFDARHLLQVFETLDTKDFEQVIRSLEDTSKILPIYGDATSSIARMAEDVEELKRILVRTITNRHPSHSGDISFELCRIFLSYFIGSENEDGNVYTLNYDLLLYWALRYKDSFDHIELNDGDGFGNGGDMPVIWRNNDGANVHYLHGALHFFYEGSELHKYTRKGGGPIRQQVLDAISLNKFPLFVAEGRSEQKLSKIIHNGYLLNSYNSFSQKMEQEDGTLFIFGHSLAENDRHILDRIAEGRISRVYVSLREDATIEERAELVASCRRLEAQRQGLYPDNECPLEVKLFKAETARVWGQQRSINPAPDDIPF